VSGNLFRVLIVDYGMGNVRSVHNAFEAVGAPARISRDPADLDAAERIVLPGVGAFGEAMARLGELGLIEPLAREVLGRKKPFLGICLGMQLIADRSFEHGEHRGLGWIAGDVKLVETGDPQLRVPHIGWNAVRTTDCPLFAGLGKDPAFYFVHSYHFVPADPSTVAGVTNHGSDLVVAVARGNVFGTQFHPEKSHKAGLALLKNFVAWSGPC
jgi:glutamine amidotransferase